MDLFWEGPWLRAISQLRIKKCDEEAFYNTLVQLALCSSRCETCRALGVVRSHPLSEKGGS